MNISIGIGIPRAAVTLRKRGASPKEIFGSSLELWLRSDVGVTTASGAVSEWADVLSGKGRTFSQGTAASRPTYNTTDANWNGLPSLTFDGSDDFLGSDDVAGVYNFMHDGTGGYALVVYRTSGVTDDSQHLIANGAASAADIGFRYIAGLTGDTQQFNIASGAAVIVTEVVADENNATLQWVAVAFEDGRVGNEYLVSRPGYADVTGNGGAPTASDAGKTLKIGSNQDGFAPFEGEIVEVIMASTYPTADQLTALQAYIERRYGLWTPDSIFGAGLHTWLRSDDLALADGASVSAWADRSGNGHDFSMATSSRQPTFNASDSSYRGKPSLTFASDRMESDDLASVWSYLHDGTGGTLVVVGEYTGITGGNNNMASTRDTIGTGRGVAMEIDGSNDMRLRISNGTADIVDLIETAETKTPRYFIAAYEDGRAGNEALITVSSNETTGNDTGAPSVSDPQLTLSLGGIAGGGKYCPCKIVEVIAVTRYLTDSEKTRLATYFSRRYGL